MPHTLDSRASLLLELMREADDEAVTLDELAIAGIEDPATALLSLEQAGFGVERVLDTTERGQTLPCVRLARPTWPIDEPARTLECAAVRPVVVSDPDGGSGAPTAARRAPVVVSNPHSGGGFIRSTQHAPVGVVDRRRGWLVGGVGIDGWCRRSGWWWPSV